MRPTCSSYGLGNADWRVGRQHAAAVVRLRLLDTPLDLADVVEILIEPRAIARPETRSQPRRLLRDEIEDAAIALPSRGALRRAAGLAEQPLEHRARIDLHRQRRRRRAPRDRVGVGAAVSRRARADVAGEVLGGELERRKRRVLPDLSRPRPDRS